MALPSGYTPLEYIESTGSQYVDTGFKHNNNTRVVMKAQVTTKPSTHAWLFEGRTQDVSHKSVFLLSGSTWTTDYLNGSDGRYAFSSVGVTDLLNIDYNKNVVNINGYTHTYAATTFQSDYNLVLFAANTAGTVAGYISARIWKAQIYDNGVLIRDYIPVQRLDGTVGLLDKVNNVFYPDAAGGNFIPGPDVIWTELEYIESTGTQYVDTKFKPNQDTQVAFDFKLKSTNVAYVYGCRGGSGDKYNNRYGILYTSTGYRSDYGDGNGPYFPIQYTTNERYFSNKQKNVCYLGDEFVTNISAAFQSPRNLFLFGCNEGGDFKYGAVLCVYSCQIYDNGNQVLLLVPAMRTSGEVGLIDTLTGFFYGNSGTGAFIAGPLAAKPEAPASLELIGTTRNAAILAWPGAPVGQNYRLYRDGVVVYEGSALCYTDTGLAAGSTHVYSIHTLSGSTESEGVTTEATTTEGIVLITDRTAADVSAGRRKGYYNALDLIRVGEAMAYLEERFAAVGISVTVSPKLDWQLTDIPTHAQALHYLEGLEVLRDKLLEYRETVSAPGSLTALTWASANDIETILLDVENLIHTIILSYRHYSGRTISGVNVLP